MTVKSWEEVREDEEGRRRLEEVCSERGVKEIRRREEKGREEVEEKEEKEKRMERREKRERSDKEGMENKARRGKIDGRLRN